MKEYLTRHKWMVGKNYYMAKNRLLKEKFKMIDFDKDWKTKSKAKVIYSDGICYIEITTNIFTNPKTKQWNCGKVLECKEWTED